MRAARCWQASSRRTWSAGLAAKEQRFAHCQLPGTGAEEPGVAAALRLEVADALLIYPSLGRRTGGEPVEQVQKLAKAVLSEELPGQVGGVWVQT